MSKSEGNFRTLRDCISMYGVDATRVALADAGDSLDDSNFDENVANSAILRLFVLEKWISDEIKK
jgi:leucyl-tRNA synthetase